MKPNECSGDYSWEEISAFVDGESTQPEVVSAHLGSCPTCLAKADAIRTIGECVRGLPLQHAPDPLRSRVVALATPATRKTTGRRMMVIATAAAIAIAAVFVPVVLRNTGQTDVLPIYWQDHVSIVQAQTETGLVSSDANQLEEWLGARLDFATSIPRWPWAEYSSARVCSLRGSRVALVRLRSENRELSLFVHPPLNPSVSGGGTPQHPSLHTTIGYDSACWDQGGLEYVLVAPSPAGDLFKRLAEK